MKTRKLKRHVRRNVRKSRRTKNYKGGSDDDYENDIYLWDIAAGVLLVKEAGGKIYMKRKGNSWKYEVLASNKFIFDEACKLLVK